MVEERGRIVEEDAVLTKLFAEDIVTPEDQVNPRPNKCALVNVDVFVPRPSGATLDQVLLSSFFARTVFVSVGH